MAIIDEEMLTKVGFSYFWNKIKNKFGDMSKSVYDTDNSGVVDTSDSVLAFPKVYQTFTTNTPTLKYSDYSDGPRIAIRIGGNFDDAWIRNPERNFTFTITYADETTNTSTSWMDSFYQSSGNYTRVFSNFVNPSKEIASITFNFPEEITSVAVYRLLNSYNENYYNPVKINFKHDNLISYQFKDPFGIDHDLGDLSYWEIVCQTPYNFYGGGAVFFNDELHILGGYSSSYQKFHQKWDGNTWTSVSTLPINVDDSAVVITYNDEIHILKNTYHYKWNGEEWIQLNNLPYSFTSGSAVVYKNELHIFGGTGSYSSYHRKWNKTTDSWSMEISLPYSNFYNANVVIHNDQIHILGGSAGHQMDHYKLEGNSWIQVSTLPYNSYMAKAIETNGEIHLIGGTPGNGEDRHKKHYKFTNDKEWEKASDLAGPLWLGNALVYNDSIYLVGGDIYQNESIAGSSMCWVRKSKNLGLTNVTGILPVEKGGTGVNYKTHVDFWNELDDVPYDFGGMAYTIIYKDKIHLMGGVDRSSYPKSHYTWDPMNGWVLVEETISWMNNGMSTWAGFAFIYDDKIHVIYEGASTVDRGHYEWDGETWTASFDLPSVSSCRITSLIEYQNQLHIFGRPSESVDDYKKHYIWNSDNNEWTMLNDLSFDIITKSQVFIYRNKLYFVNVNRTTINDEMYAYYWDSTNDTLIQDFIWPRPVSSGTVIVLNDYIYLLGGYDNLIVDEELNDYMWVYNGKSWSSINKRPYPTLRFEALSYHGEIHILGDYYTRSKYAHAHYRSVVLESGGGSSFNYKETDNVAGGKTVTITS